jgi:hypothetical protein
VIFRDIHRTFPAHEFFREAGGAGQEALFRQLSLLHPDNMQCCRSGMFIPDSDFCPSRISDQKIATKEWGENKFVVLPVPFFVATKITKL